MNPKPPIQVYPPEIVELAKTWQRFGMLLRQASTLSPPQAAEMIRLDAVNAGRERDVKPD